MNDLEIWLIIVLLTLATALTRSSFWLIGHHVIIPKRVQEVLRYAPACALAAIIVPDLFLNNGQVELSLSNYKLLAGILAIIFYAVKPDMLLTILFGMTFFTVLRLATGF